MAKKSVGIRGRWIVAAVLVGFVVTTAAVITRRSYGDREARRISTVEAKLRQLRNERVRLESEIREGSSRVRLIPIAETRLGMHVPADTEVVILSRRSGTNADR